MPLSASPVVRLEARLGAGRPTDYEIGEGGFLIGTVPGCDLRLPGANLAPVLCLIDRHARGASLRKLAPMQPIFVNGSSVGNAKLDNGDRITIAGVDLLVSIAPASTAALPETPTVAAETTPPARFALPPDQLRQLEADRAEWRRRREQIEADLERQAAETEKLQAGLKQRESELHTSLADATRLQRETAVRQAELETLSARIERERTDLVAREQALAEREKELHRERAQRVEDVQAREGRVADEGRSLEAGQKRHREDLIRLDRLQATLDQRKKHLDAQALEVDRRFEQLQRDSRELEEQATQLDDWHTRLAADDERSKARTQEQDAARKQVEQRATALEGQQATLAALRTRLERLREELRRQEQALGEQRAAQEACEADLRVRREAAQRLQDEVDAEKQLNEFDRRQLDEQRATLAASVEELQKTQMAVLAEKERLLATENELRATAADQEEQAGLLAARGQQLESSHARLTAERQALRDRESLLAKSEQTIASLQEQLRKRDEELAGRERAAEENEKKWRAELDALDARRQALEDEQRQTFARLETQRAELDARAADLESKGQLLTQQQDGARAEAERLQDAEKSLDRQRQALAAERVAREVERQAAAESAQRTQAEGDAIRVEVLQLAEQVPELEARAAASLDRLTRGREQLREYLAEVHAYARQSRDDLVDARSQVQLELQQLRQREQMLHAARDEHRLAVAAFRQQLLDWQTQVGEMKQVMQQGESHLDRRRAEVDERAERIAFDYERLARQADQLQAQERLVADKRDEVERHLNDMREWYRRKMRELSGIDADAVAGDVSVAPLPVAPSAEQPTVRSEDVPAPEQSILALTGDVDPGDKQLGALLRASELIDADTLTALLLKARRQRKSLRQLLLAGNYLTLYQMALIEAGNLGGLVLGPVRVIDRVRATPHETVYRVFDPRHNREALLRHLAETEMHDAVRPDEFRQRFAAAAQVTHEHLAATFEMLEIGGRPAVLHEWLNGVSCSDWPALAAAPGVWFRLLTQATLALHAAHAAGLIHGHLQGASFVMTGAGVLKLRGLGEPHWLVQTDDEGIALDGEASVAGDLAALGRVAASWLAASTSRKGGKAKPLPEALQALLDRLTGSAADVPASAAALLEDLERIGVDVPANAAAWERFVRQVREQSADLSLRRSA